VPTYLHGYAFIYPGRVRERLRRLRWGGARGAVTAERIRLFARERSGRINEIIEESKILAIGDRLGSGDWLEHMIAASLCAETIIALDPEGAPPQSTAVIVLVPGGS
jgi:hypothetical protein